MRSTIVVAVAAALVVSGGIGVARDLGDPDPAAPIAVTEPFSSAALRADDLGTAIQAMQQRLEALPTDDQTWAALAVAYVELARVTGDPTSYPKAAAAIRRSTELRPEGNALAAAASAALAAARHDFSRALRQADAALAMDPYQPGALSIRVDALTELGRYHDQLAALQQADRRQPGVSVLARYSYAYELRGRTEQATALLHRALASAPTAADRAYLATLLADLARRTGSLHESQRLLEQALHESPDMAAAMAARARLAVARGDLAAAAIWWERAVQRLPLPEYLTELGELHAVQGRHRLARRQWSVVDATQRLLAANGVNTDLEMALHEADHGNPRRALEAARLEWRARRSISVADAYAWALHANGHDHRALVLSRQATRLGTPDARLWVHRGTIEAALGLEAAARRHLRRGLALDPGYSPWQVARAEQVLRGLGVRR